MNSNTASLRRACTILAAGSALALTTSTMNAQVKTQTEVKEGSSAQAVSVERGEVVYVSGNELMVKMEDGTMRHFANVAEDVRVEVDGKLLGIHDLKPGMKLQRTITTTTTPRTVTTVQSVTGRVWHVAPPSSVILTMENGENQAFKIPKDQKFMVDGKETDAWGLRKGMNVSATKVVEVPETMTGQQKQLTGSMPAPPPADMPILIAEPMPEEPAMVEPAPAQLPKTGSQLPFIGLLGLLSLATSFGIRSFRRS